jgi:hypothetical protein
VEDHRFMPSEHLTAVKLWGRRGSLVILDEFDVSRLIPDPVCFKRDAISQWYRLWPEARWVLPTLLFTIFPFRGDDDWIADADLYEVLTAGLGGTHEHHVGELELPPMPSDDLDGWARNAQHRRAPEAIRTLYQERARYLNGQRFVSRIAVHGHQLVYYPEPEIPEELYNHTAVLLNATADVETLVTALRQHRGDYPIELYKPDVALAPQTEIRYVIDANHSQTSIEKNGHGYQRRWVQRVREAIGESDHALVMATKGGEDVLRQELADLIHNGQVVLDHYGAVSGRNEYEDCDTVVLAQPFNPPPPAVAGMYRSLYGGGPGEPLSTDICSRPRSFPWLNEEGKTYEVSVTSMRDERLAPLYEHWRRSEMYQAAHRVRPVLHKRRIVVTCAVPLEGLEPTSISYTDGRPGTRAKLVAAAERLLQNVPWLSRQSLAEESGLHLSTVSRHWSALVDSLGLQLDQMRVPSDRYPGGRLTETAKRA